MIKYGPPSLKTEIARIMNEIFKYHKDTVNIGRAILQPLLKNGKDMGPVKHLSGVNLLNTIRKIMVNVTLNRVNIKVDNYLSPSQAAYRKGRSTTDMIWAHRFVIAKVQKYQELEVYITGMDMSSAFDTIHRHKLLEELEKFQEEDEIRMIRLLISNTTITVRTNEVMSEPFASNFGSPQGDGLSGTLFNITFESALRKIRSKINIQQPEIEHSYSKIRSQPSDELIYADDCDFENDDKVKTRVLNEIAAPTLKEENLFVNESKLSTQRLKEEKGYKKPGEE